MAPLIYDVDVWAGTRELADLRFRVAIDWDPEYAEYTDRLLSGHVQAAIRATRAFNIDPGDFRLVLFPIDRYGQRDARERPFLWRAPLDPREEPPWRR